MYWSLRSALCCAGFSFLMLVGARAEGPSFEELLARAHAEAAAGHQWEPAGDNVTETFMQMMNLLPQATPEQLADFQGLLQTQQQVLGKAAKSVPGNADSHSTATGADAASPSGHAMTRLLEDGAAAAAETRVLPSGSTAEAKSAEAGAAQPATEPAIEAHNPPSTQAPQTAMAEQLRGEADVRALSGYSDGGGRAYATREMPQTSERSSTITPAHNGNASPAANAAASTPVLPPEAEVERPAPDAAPSRAEARPTIGPSAALRDDARETASVTPGIAQPAPTTVTQPAPAGLMQPRHPPASFFAVPPALVGDLFARGQAAEKRGDISGARRYYESAAGQGLAPAAYALARLYDPAYLGQKAIGGIAADPAQADLWYHRAAMLDHKTSKTLPETLSAR